MSESNRPSKDDVQRCPHGISLTAVPPCHFCDHAQYVEWASPQLERLGHEMADNAWLRAALRKASERFSWLARFHLNAEYSKRAARDLSEEFWKVQAGEIQQDETSRCRCGSPLETVQICRHCGFDGVPAVEPSEQPPVETGLRTGELAQLRRIDAAARFYVDSVKPGTGLAWENLMNALFDGRPEKAK